MDTAARTDGEAVVGAFLAALGSRDVEAAARLMAPGCRLVFPGAAPMAELSEVIAWAAARYRSIGKAVAAVESFDRDGVQVVYVRGTLHGDWPDGTAFEGIRFVDRFELRDGLIARQEVWNDLAEMRPGRGA